MLHDLRGAGVTVYSRSATYKGRPESIEDGFAFLSNEAAPAIMGMPNCIGMSVIADRKTGYCVVTTAWPTTATMHASVSKIRPIRERAAKILGGAAEVEEWEVAAMHRRYTAPEAGRVRVTWLRVEPGGGDATVGDFTTAVLPALGNVRGFCGASLLLNREWGRAVISIACDSDDAVDRLPTRMLRPDGSRVGSGTIEVVDFDLVLPHLRVPDIQPS